MNITVRWPSTRKSRASNRRSRNSRRGTKSKAVKAPPGGWKISFSPNFFTMGLAQIGAERIANDFDGSSDGDESSDDRTGQSVLDALIHCAQDPKAEECRVLAATI